MVSGGSFASTSKPWTAHEAPGLVSAQPEAEVAWGRAERTMDQGQVFTPRAAAQELGVSAATLRRYVLSYERVFDKLEPGEHGRLYPAQVLDRLSSAKKMQESGQAVSLEQALLMLREGVEAPTPPRVEAEALWTCPKTPERPWRPSCAPRYAKRCGLSWPVRSRSCAS